MASCFTLFQMPVARVTKLDACGAPVPGLCSQVTSDGYISVALSPEYEDPDEFLVKNAAGALCLNERSEPQFKWYTVAVEFCKVDPELYSMISGGAIVTDGATPTPSAIGFRSGTIPVGSSWALEMWSKVSGVACGGSPTFGYTLLPWIVEGTLGELTYENGGGR